MDLGSTFLLLALILGVAIFVAWPFLERTPHKHAINQKYSTLLAERDQVLNAIQELDFDNTLGKIPVEDYPKQREELLEKGSEIYSELETIKAEGESKPELRNKTNLTSDEEIEDLIAKRRNEHKEKTAGFCPHCGNPVMLTDEFCPKCGTRLK